MSLQRKVRNVTFGYIVEHEDEERLFEELAIQLTKALSKHGSAREEAVQAFVCKAEQIHTTVGKHLAKEEEQLLPLLLENFRLCDQARLVAHFLACIPLDAAPCVLAWLKRDMAPQVLEQLRKQVAEAVDASLSASARDVLVAWLAEGAVPTAQAALSEGTMTAAEEREIGSSAIDAVIHVHDVIRESLGNLVEEARTLQAAAEGATQPLVGMLEVRPPLSHLPLAPASTLSSIPASSPRRLPIPPPPTP